MQALLPPERVLDLSDEKGLLAGQILAGLGADVVKVERPGGDMSRNIGPFYHNIPHPERSLFWFALNTGKRGITLNIETADGREIFRRLVKTAHFVIESFPPGYMDSLGLGHSVLSQINPRIITASITPFGQNGPYAHYKGSDLTMMAMGGLMFISGEPDRAPLRISIDHVYHLASLQAASGIMIARHFRELTGKGQYIDVSIQESILPTLTYTSVPSWYAEKNIWHRSGTFVLRNSLSVRVMYECKDGHISWRLQVGQQGTRTANIVRWMDEEGMAGELAQINWTEIDLHTLSQQQLENWEEVFSRFYLTHTKAEIYEEAVKRDFSVFPIHTVADILESRQLKAREFWVELSYPELNTSLIHPGAPFKSDKTAYVTSYRAPYVGEHNEEIYNDELGLSKDELAILKRHNII